MMYTFDRSDIEARLKELSETRRLAFGIFLLERALPAYFQFQADSGTSGGAELRAALAQCWGALEFGERNGGPKFVTVEACEKAMPDSEDHTSIYTSAAIDAANIACCLLSYLDSGELSNLMEAVEARWDTLYLFIINSTDIDPAVDGFQKDVLRNPLMQNELRLLHEDLASLKDTSEDALVLAIKRVNETAVERVAQRLAGHINPEN
jgi:uncharacterized protein YjaG (DUF416 family)